MAQDPYSALAGGLERGMNIAAAFQQYKDKQEQQKIDTALTGLKMHMTLLDPNMPKAANKVGLNGVIKMMSDPTLSKAMGLQIPQGFDISAVADDQKGLASIYKEVAPIFAKAQKGEIDKATALMLTGNVVNQYAATVTQERELMKELRSELDNAFKIPEKIEEKRAMIDAGFEETPEMRRKNDILSGITGKQMEIGLGLAETPATRRQADLQAGIRGDLTRVDLGLKETPEQARQRDLVVATEKKDRVSPDDALRRISNINQARAQLEKGGTFTPMLLALRPELAESFKSGDQIPADVRLKLSQAWNEEESYLRQFAPRQDYPKVGTMPSHGKSKTPTIRTDADYDALPSGTEFIAPDGTTRRKP